MSGFSHIELIVSDLEVSSSFYLKALAPLGFVRADSEPGMFIRLTNGRDASIELSTVDDRFKGREYNRGAVGLGHLALAVESKELLDMMESHLNELNIPITVGLSMAYRGGYDCFYFEDPDQMYIEIVHHNKLYFAPQEEEEL